MPVLHPERPSTGPDLTPRHTEGPFVYTETASRAPETPSRLIGIASGPADTTSRPTPTVALHLEHACRPDPHPSPTFPLHTPPPT